MVSKRTLLFIAGLVWLAAGVNILRIGLKVLVPLFSGGSGRLLPALGLAALICAAFSMMFHRIVLKHTARILAYETKQPFYRFFDGRSYLLMAFMMTLGITLRRSGVVPEFFFAWFYTGLGTALSIAGVRFLVRCVTKFR